MRNCNEWYHQKSKKGAGAARCLPQNPKRRCEGVVSNAVKIFHMPEIIGMLVRKSHNSWGNSHCLRWARLLAQVLPSDGLWPDRRREAGEHEHPEAWLIFPSCLWQSGELAAMAKAHDSLSLLLFPLLLLFSPPLIVYTCRLVRRMLVTRMSRRSCCPRRRAASSIR